MTEEQKVAEYLLYTRIQDHLMTMGTNAILRVSVNLYSIKKNGREYYKNEIQYFDKQGNLARKIARRIDGVLTIENMKPFNGKKEYIVIRSSELELMRIILLPWFEHIIKEFNSIYQVLDDKLHIVREIAAIELDTPGNTKLWFKPGIYSNDYTEEVSPCMDMFLNDPENISKVPYDSIYGFMHILRTFQLHQYISTMLASFEQPLMGLSLYDITNSQSLNDVKSFKYEEPDYIKRQREEQKKGFFDREIEKQNNSK